MLNLQYFIQGHHTQQLITLSVFVIEVSCLHFEMASLLPFRKLHLEVFQMKVINTISYWREIVPEDNVITIYRGIMLATNFCLSKILLEAFLQ